MNLWLALAVARADEPLSVEDEERARQLFVHGQERYDQASALERLGRWDEALEALEQYRDDARPEELETLERRITSLRGSVALLSVGAAGLGSGAAFSARALSARGQWTEQCVQRDPRLCPSSAAALVQRDTVSSLMRRLLDPAAAAPTPVQASSWAAVTDTLGRGGRIDIEGASGDLDFDPDTGEVSNPVEIRVIQGDDFVPVVCQPDGSRATL